MYEVRDESLVVLTPRVGPRGSAYQNLTGQRGQASGCGWAIGRPGWLSGRQALAEGVPGDGAHAPVVLFGPLAQGVGQLRLDAEVETGGSAPVKRGASGGREAGRAQAVASLSFASQSLLVLAGVLGPQPRGVDHSEVPAGAGWMKTSPQCSNTMRAATSVPVLAEGRQPSRSCLPCALRASDRATLAATRTIFGKSLQSRASRMLPGTLTAGIAEYVLSKYLVRRYGGRSHTENAGGHPGS